MAPRKRSPLLYPRQRALYPSGKRAVDRRFLSVYMALVFFLLFGCLFLSQLVSDAPGAVLEPLEPGLLEEMFRPRSPSDERSPLGFPDSSEYDPPANVNMSTLFKMAESRPDHWQRVRRTNDRFYVFSAYLDTRRARAVRIIAAARTRLTDRVVCRLFWKTTDGREFQVRCKRPQMDTEERFLPLASLNEGLERAYHVGLDSHSHALLAVVEASATVPPQNEKYIDSLEAIQDRDGPGPHGGCPQATTVLASNKLIRENWNLRYSAFFLLCPLPPGMTGETPLWVSVQRLNDRALPRNVLLVHRRDQHPRPPEELAVCVKPIHYDYNKVLQFAEFVELNLALGVSHFVLYNHTVGPDVGCLLERYVSERLVTLLPWQLPIASQREIRTEALFAALNDCLYRTMHAFRWVAMIDLDEFIVPAGNLTLPAMLRRLHAAHQRAGAYSFRNAFFYLQWPDDPAAARDRLPLVTMRKTLRKAHLHAHRQRSKCILEPESVVEVGNHFVWEFLAGKATVNVASSVAFLHHYRVCEFGGNDCVNASSVRDARLHFWKPRLLEAVGRRVRMLRRRDLACPGQGNGTAAHRSSLPGRS